MSKSATRFYEERRTRNDERKYLRTTILFSFLVLRSSLHLIIFQLSQNNFHLMHLAVLKRLDQVAAHGLAVHGHFLDPAFNAFGVEDLDMINIPAERPA